MQDTTEVISVTEYVVKFKETKNILYLLTAIFLVIKRGRTHELLYGIYCKWFHSPSELHPQDVDHMLETVMQNKEYYNRQFLSVDQLQGLYGDKYAISKIPSWFAGTRTESIIEQNDYLLMGEYGMDNNSARIAHITPNDCTIHDHYQHVSGVRHIHATHQKGEDPKDGSIEFLVATGDRLKVLDLWKKTGDQLYFVKRIKRFLAGYTAIANISNQFYYGTDFTARPNYIEKENGKKLFFPEKAFSKYVISFFTLKDRYLLVFSGDLAELGGKRTLSILDTNTDTFIYCDYIKLEG